MAKAADLGDVSRDYLSKRRVVIGSSPTGTGIVEKQIRQAQAFMKMIEPLRPQWEAARLFGNDWSRSVAVFAEHARSIQLLRDQLGLNDNLRAASQMKLLSDYIEPGALDAIRAPYRSWPGDEIRQLMEGAKIGAESIAGITRPMQKHALEIAKLLEGLRIPRFALDSELLHGFLSRSPDFAENAQLLDESALLEAVEPTESVEVERPGGLDAPAVVIRPLPSALLAKLRLDPSCMRELSPDQFEHLIADQLYQMGLEPLLTGGINRADGAVDIIATPRQPLPFGCIVAVQCAHRSTGRGTGPRKVREMSSRRGKGFNFGIVVTNTTFTKAARFEAQQPENKHFLRLRDFKDIAEWIKGNYAAELSWPEMPREFELLPGFTIKLPKRPA